MTLSAKLLFVAVLLVHLVPVLFLLLVAVVVALPVMFAKG
jgi:hypothetical protein